VPDIQDQAGRCCALLLVLTCPSPIPIVASPPPAHAVTAAAKTLQALLPTLAPMPLTVEIASGPGPQIQHGAVLLLLLLVCLAPSPAGPASCNCSLLAENTGAALLLLLLMKSTRCSAAILLLLILVLTIIVLLLLPCAAGGKQGTCTVLCCIVETLSKWPSWPTVNRGIRAMLTLMLLTLLLTALLVVLTPLWCVVVQGCWACCCLWARSIGALRQPRPGSRRLHSLPFQLLQTVAAKTSPARAAEACCSGQVRCAAAVAVAAQPARPGGKLNARHVLQQVDHTLTCVCIISIPNYTVYPELSHLLLYVWQLRDLLYVCPAGRVWIAHARKCMPAVLRQLLQHGVRPGVAADASGQVPCKALLSRHVLLLLHCAPGFIQPAVPVHVWG
jgi:hypothetical protein